MQNDLKYSGDSPVVINYNGSADDIYAPVRTSSADIRIVTSGILDDLYTAKKDDICVRIKKGNTVIWEGYKQPNTYSQDVTPNLDEIEMTCIDPLSILKFVTIDKIVEKAEIKTYGQLIGKALAYVKLDADSLWVERAVSYGGNYSGSNGLLDLKIQVNNFWDEADDPGKVYEMIEEMLRPFCLTLVYYNNSYQIYCVNKTSGTRYFDKYTIGNDGTLTLTSSNQSETKATGQYRFASDEWISNNVATPTVEIGNTYDKVTCTASTMVPTYDKMAGDVIKMSDIPAGGYEDLNVETNKTKGYVRKTVWVQMNPQTNPHPQNVLDQDTDSHWFYLWNGVYTDEDYGLGSAGGYTNWYINMNKAKYYLDGSTGHPNDTGSVLNFYGGSNNPAGTGKSQSQEKAVEIKKKITAYAADNGVPLEFLEVGDLAWTFNRSSTPILTKSDTSNSKWGTSHTMGNSNRVVYHQEYDNVTISSIQDYVLNISLAQSYSRTGTDVKIDVMNNNTATNKTWYNQNVLNTCSSNYFPIAWEAENVKVDSLYFRRYSAGTTCEPVWDERMIVIYVKLSDGTYKQFNGFEWVADSGNHSNPFWLTRMITYENLYHNDMRYNMIRGTINGNSRYSLTDEDIFIYYDNDMGVTDSETDLYTKATPYKKLGYDCVFDCSEGQLSIRLPYLDDLGATVTVEIYNSTILGMTGMDSSITAAAGETEPFYYTATDNVTFPTTDFRKADVKIGFFPVNVSYVKAEHLDLEMEITVPKSNLGQMFSESDIKYEINSNQNYVEEFSGPSFQVNTYNPLVASSWSYLIYNNALADPGQFKVMSKTVRPEAFTVQAYFNWLNVIRKTFNKTILPVAKSRPFANVRCYVKTPEIGTNELLVVADSWDVKTNRHTIIAVEDQGLEVSTVSGVNSVEVPRMARAERWNLPTATRQTLNK